MRYAEHLQEKRQEKLTNEQQIQKEFVSNIMNRGGKNYVTYVVKSDALKRKSTKKKVEFKSLEESLLALQEKRKKL